ncbi:MAG: glycosyltransferase family 39 protein [Pirellulales bacterium]|nr:glycosyltransferase family 39 protein [Pirellulales bacterium]
MGRIGSPGDSWQWWTTIGVLLAATIFFYPVLLGIPLLDPDEGLHAAIAQEMVERGDWVVPSFLGKPFLDKPIFYFWAEALSLRCFGMHEAAVRLPGLMFGLLGAITTGVVGWRMFGRTTGLLAGLLYATMILPTALAQAAAHDVALVPWVSLAVLLFWESDRAATRRAALAYALAIGLLLGLTCLTKGLVGVALVGVAYGGYLLIARKLTLAACLRGAGALAVAALVASTWYLAVELRHPGYLHYYFIERHLLGYSTATQVHGDAAWWYYLPILLGGGLPWIAYLPVTVHDAWASRKQPDRGAPAERPTHGATLLLWCWLIGCTVFLSTSHSKLVTYIWPVFPAVAVLAALAWVRLLEGTLAEGARRAMGWTLCSSCLGGPVVLPLALLVVQAEFSTAFSPLVWTAALLAACAAAVPAAFWITGRFRATISAALLSTAAQFAVIMTFVLPPVAASVSARDLARHFNRRARLPSELLIADERLGSIVFYLDRDLRAELPGGRLKAVQLRDIAAFPSVPPGAVLALPESRVDGAGRQFLDLAQLEYRPAGRYRLYDAVALQPRFRTAAAAPGVLRR